MNRLTFKARLAERPLLLDGAMGTVLHAAGQRTPCLDRLNLDAPAVVADVHRAYIDAGADIIETNTFGANRYKLAEFGLADRIADINRAAIDIARRAIAGSFQATLLAGSIGPLGVRLRPLGRVTPAAARAAFVEQIAALSEGVDLLLIETMSDVAEVRAAVEAAREVVPTLPVIVTLTFTRDDRTLLGLTAAQAAQALAASDIDALGVNCGSGPAQVLRLLGEMRGVGEERPLLAMPNAGFPEQSDGGRLFYPATPAYFADYAQSFAAAGVALIGGCCGTTPDHTAAMRAALDAPRPKRVTVATMVERPTSGDTPPATHLPPTQLATALAEGNFVVSIEMSPPRGIGTERMLAAASSLRDAGAGFINVADNPLARMRMSAWAAAYLLLRDAGIEPILHFPTRGRNLLRVQGDLLAAHALGVRNLFVTMGDPTRIGDYPEAMDSYDIVPTGLIRLIKEQFNAGRDKAGQAIDEPTGFVVGGALSLTPADPDREVKLLRKKVEHGVDFLLTQPVFDPVAALSLIDRYEALYEEACPPVLVGIKPLFNSKNAEFLHHEVPGIAIPKSFRRRMREAADPAQEGVAIAQELLLTLRPKVAGVYLMPAFGRFYLAAEVLDVLKTTPAASPGA